MSTRKVLLYFAWSRPGEAEAPLLAIEDRFPALFELRRLSYPDFERIADPERVDQGIAGFLDHVQKRNFDAFVKLAETLSGTPAVVVERVDDDGAIRPLDDGLIADCDTIVVISFDSLRTRQCARSAEVEALGEFLRDPDHLLFICPHHDIGQATGAGTEERIALQTAEHLHHGDRVIPPRQGFGGFARSVLEGLGVPIDNRFGLHPAAAPDGTPAPVDVDRVRDRHGFLQGVEALNLHAHLPQLERVGSSQSRMEVLVRQRVDPDATPHPFTRDGRTHFDSLLQSAPGVFGGTLLVGDTTLFSSTAGGLDNLERLWTNLLERLRLP